MMTKGGTGVFHFEYDGRSHKAGNVVEDGDKETDFSLQSLWKEPVPLTL